MKKSVMLFAFLAATGASSLALADYPIMDRVAAKIIQKYQTSTCQQLWEQKAASQGKPKSPEEQRAVELLKSDQAMRDAFFAQISAPIVTKMFECGMIP